MERRNFMKAAGVAGVISLSGCADLLGGNGGNNDDGYAGEPVDMEEVKSDNLFRVDFHDQADTLGQLDRGDTESEADDIVNNHSEGEWQEMDDNDLEVAQRILNNNDSSIEEIRPWVEDALNRELEPEVDHWQAPPGRDAADERALMYGIGVGLSEESTISDSYDSANVLKPLAERLASEYLDNEVFEAWITGATLPATQGRFAHLPITMAYERNGEIRTDYVEDGVPSSPRVGDDNAIRSAEESIYSDQNEMEYVTGHEYSKALEMAQNGKIEQEGRAHPVRAISTGLLTSMWNMVDSAQNDLNFESPPPNGLVTHVDPEFGRSVEDAFYNLDEEKLEYMENIGRGMQLFYEEHDGRTNLAVGGTLEEPEFYEFGDGLKETLWNFEYDDLSELEG
jgi:hypothetical protein